MPTTVKEKDPMAGAKRKAEMIKEGPSKGSKKPKIDSVQSAKPRGERNGNIRPEKTDVVARRLVAGALGVPVPKRTENSGVSSNIVKKNVKTPKAQVTKVKGPVVKEVTVQAQADSSDEDSVDIDEDGGVMLDNTEDSDDSGEPLPSIHQGVHTDRVKANGNDVGLNGTIFYSILSTVSN
jgi:hypothetical protein